MTREIRVLHVDDDPDFVSLAADFLERTDEHLVVETATSPDTGLDRLDDEIDCVVSDYNMPGTSGIEFLEAVREQYPELPFILFTGRGSEEVASEAISAGVTDYLQKEAGTEQYELLANRIRNAVQQFRASRAAEQTERRLEELAGKADDVLWMYSADWEEALFVNSAFEEVWGISPDEFEATPKQIMAQIHPEYRMIAAEAMEQLAAGESIDIELRLDSEDERWVQMQGDPIVDDSGDVVRFVGLSRDITEQKQREQRLERERDRFSTLFENLPNPAVHGQLTPDGPIVQRVNPAFAETFGQDGSEAVGANITDLVVPPGGRSEVSALLEDLVSTGRQSAEVRRETPDGVRDFRLDAVLTDRESETPEGYAIYTDITDRKTRERKLTALHDVAVSLESCTSVEAVCEQTIEASNDILEFDLSVVTIEENGYLKQRALSAEMDYDNTSAMRVDEGLVGKTYQSGESYLVNDLQSNEEAKPQGPFRSIVSVPIGRHGVFQAVDQEPGAFDETDLELAELLISHTASALSRIEREQTLQQQNETLERFTEIVSHDLRNPLSAAHARAELIDDELDSEHVDALIETIDRMEALIEDLSTIAHEDTELTGESALVLSDVARDCWETVDTDGGGLTVDTDLTIRANRSRLLQLLENLYVNAKNHGGEDVTVTIGSLEDRDGFYVADDGRGIPPDERDQIFESGYTTAQDGTGLGLSIVAEVAEAHGWSLDVTESAAGGARFELWGVDTVET